MLFGSRGKPKSLFPTMGGMSPQPMQQAPMQEPVMQSAAQPVQGGMEAMQPKKPGVNWLGVLADALAGAAGQPGQYLAGIQAQQQRAAALADKQRERSLDMSDWQAKQEWSIKNAPPKTNDTIEDFNWFKSLSPQDRATYHELRPQFQAVTNPDGTRTIYPMSGGGQQSAPSFSPEDWNGGVPVGGVSAGAPPFPRR